MPEWPTTFQPHVEAILAAHPELRDRFRIIAQDGYAEFVEAPTRHLPDGSFDAAWYTEQDRLWNRQSFDGDEEGERVVGDHTWRVHTNAYTGDADVWCDGVKAEEGPDFKYAHYQAFELVELGLWPVPDFRAIWEAEVLSAERAIRHHDDEVARAPARRVELVAKLAAAREKLDSLTRKPLTPLEQKAQRVLHLLDQLHPGYKQSWKENFAVEMMAVPDDALEEAVQKRLLESS